jgi:hypothetical protein
VIGARGKKVAVREMERDAARAASADDACSAGVGAIGRVVEDQRVTKGMGGSVRGERKETN